MDRNYNSFFQKKSKLYEIFLEIFPNILCATPKSASKFFEENWFIWESYAKKRTINNSIPGSVFEKLFEIYCDLLDYEIIAQDEYFEDVPLVKPDFLLKNKSGSYLFLSFKTSLRERWKQADWEAIYFKEYYPTTDCVLVTFHKDEERNLQSKIQDNLLKGLDDSCLATSTKFDVILSNFFDDSTRF